MHSLNSRRREREMLSDALLHSTERWTASLYLQNAHVDEQCVCSPRDDVFSFRRPHHGLCIATRRCDTRISV